MAIIKWNRKYIKAVNSCDNVELFEFFDELMDDGPRNRFHRKRYLWNLLRGKSFYINAVKYVLDGIRRMESMDMDARRDVGFRTGEFIKGLLDSEPRLEVRRSFVRNICKSFPVYTIDTLPYLDGERVAKTLESTEGLVAGDEFTRPFIDQIIALNKRVHELEELNNLMNTGGN